MLDWAKPAWCALGGGCASHEGRERKAREEEREKATREGERNYWMGEEVPPEASHSKMASLPVHEEGDREGERETPLSSYD